MKRTELSLSLNLLKYHNSDKLVCGRQERVSLSLSSVKQSDGFARRADYRTSICYPPQDWFKIKRHWSAMTGENGKCLEKLMVASRSWTWRFHFISVTELGWVIQVDGYHIIHHFCFGSMLPIHLSVADMFKRSHPVKNFILCNTINLHFHNHHSWNFVSSIDSHLQKSFTSFHVVDVGYIKALLWWVIYCQHQLIIQEVDIETPFQCFEACIHQWQVFRFRRQVDINGLRLKDFSWCSTSNHLFTPCKMYCSTLRIIMIPLAFINNLHHWLVIRWCLSMFDLRTSFCMVRLVHWVKIEWDWRPQI